MHAYLLIAFNPYLLNSNVIIYNMPTLVSQNKYVYEETIVDSIDRRQGKLPESIEKASQKGYLSLEEQMTVVDSR